MKVQNCNTISAFGGINFVLNYLEEGNYRNLFDKYLPRLANQLSNLSTLPSSSIGNKSYQNHLLPDPYVLKAIPTD